MINATIISLAIVICNQTHEVEIKPVEVKARCVTTYAHCLNVYPVNYCVKKLNTESFDNKHK
jgi:hypothetical protein